MTNCLKFQKTAKILPVLVLMKDLPHQ